LGRRGGWGGCGLVWGGGGGSGGGVGFLGCLGWVGTTTKQTQTKNNPKQKTQTKTKKQNPEGSTQPSLLTHLARGQGFEASVAYHFAAWSCVPVTSHKDLCWKQLSIVRIFFCHTVALEPSCLLSSPPQSTPPNLFHALLFPPSDIFLRLGSLLISCRSQQDAHITIYMIKTCACILSSFLPCLLFGPASLLFPRAMFHEVIFILA